MDKPRADSNVAKKRRGGRLSSNGFSDSVFGIGYPVAQPFLSLLGGARGKMDAVKLSRKWGLQAFRRTLSRAGSMEYNKHALMALKMVFEKRGVV